MEMERKEKKKEKEMGKSAAKLIDIKKSRRDVKYPSMNGNRGGASRKGGGVYWQLEATIDRPLTPNFQVTTPLLSPVVSTMVRAPASLRRPAWLFRFHLS